MNDSVSQKGNEQFYIRLEFLLHPYQPKKEWDDIMYTKLISFRSLDVVGIWNTDS